MTRVRIELQPSVGDLRFCIGGGGLQEGGDLRREQAAVLVAALVRFALDVQDDPAGLRIAIGRAIALHRQRIGLRAGRLLGSRG